MIKMKFNKALKIVRKLINGRAFTLKIDYFEYSNGIKEIEYKIFIINSENSFSGKNWEEVIEKLKQYLNIRTILNIEKIDYSGIPNESLK